MSRKLLGLTVGIGLLIALTGCSKTSASTVQVALNEWSLKPSVSSVPAGSVTFQAANQGAVGHELVLIKTDIAPSALKMEAEDPTKVDENASGPDVGEIDDIPAAVTKTGTFDLAPGRYVLLCNIPAHFRSGMFAAFEVK